MSKTFILQTNFQKSPSTGGSPSPEPLIIQYWWPEGWSYVFWPNCGFLTDYEEIELQKSSYDVILVTSSSLRHRKRHQNNVTNLFHFGPMHHNQNFWLRQWWTEYFKNNNTGTFWCGRCLSFSSTASDKRRIS